MRARRASEKYAATRSGEEPKGDEREVISGRRFKASERLSRETDSAHWRRRVRRWRTRDSISGEFAAGEVVEMVRFGCLRGRGEEEEVGEAERFEVAGGVEEEVVVVVGLIGD